MKKISALFLALCLLMSLLSGCGGSGSRVETQASAPSQNKAAESAPTASEAPSVEASAPEADASAISEEASEQVGKASEKASKVIYRRSIRDDALWWLRMAYAAIPMILTLLLWAYVGLKT